MLFYYSIVEKEGEDGQKKELKLKSVTYHVEEEKEDIPTTSSGKLKLIFDFSSLPLNCRDSCGETE